MQVHILGIDIAKRVFSLHGVDKRGGKVVTKTLPRKGLLPFVRALSKCTIAMEACGGSNYWAREFRELGHEVKLIPPRYVKPYVKTNKNDANDAAAIAEAASRPHMHFAGIKEVWQQEIQFVHRVRSRLIREKTGLTNQLKGIFHEYGIVLSGKKARLKQEVHLALEIEDLPMSTLMRRVIKRQMEELERLEKEITYYDGELFVMAVRIHSGPEGWKTLKRIPR